jgi:glycosyltransferase involved in cell wall biosynthesis
MANLDSGPSPHLLHVFPTFATGGAQVRTCDILNHFGTAYRHTIIAMNGDYSARQRLVPGLNVEFPVRAFRKNETLRNIPRLRSMLREYAPDLLLTYNWGTTEWALANWLFPICPQIHVEDGFGPDEAVRQNPARALFRRIFLSRVAKVIVPSRQLEGIARGIWKLRLGLVEYIPNGVDLEHFGSRAPEAGPLIVGTVATLRKEKNLPRMIDAFSRLPAALGARLRIAGSGPESESLAALVRGKGLGDRIDLPGYCADPAPTVAGFHVFCISSDTEQMPISVLEAMAAGIPVAGTDVGDIKEMVAAENRAFITAKSDTAALAGSLETLLTDKALAHRIGEANRKRCREVFDKQKMFDHHDALYRKAMARAGRT